MSESEYTGRVIFHPEIQVMEVDFSDITFENSRIVDAFYDEIDRQIEPTGTSWYFLVNYKDCRIYELAWIRFAQRGKRLNLAHSLGSVRYAVQKDVSQSIEARAKTEHFEANLFSSREDALARIEQMKKSGT